MSLFQRFEKSAIPLMIKWSLAIAVLITTFMGALGWTLLNEQEGVFLRQTQILGKALVDQLAYSASEPLFADDTFALQLLVNRQEDNDLIVGMQVFDLNGNALVTAGISPFNFQGGKDGKSLLSILQNKDSAREWRLGDIHGEIFVSPISFKNVTAGYALVSLNKHPLEKEQALLMETLLKATLGLLGLGILMAVFVAHALSRPITRLMIAGEALSSGELQQMDPINRADEIGRVMNVFKSMASGLEVKREVEKALSRYVSPTITQQVIDGRHTTELGGTTVEASILFCDIVAFTELAEHLEPDQVSALLNHYFHYFSLASTSCVGSVDKFIGDCVMIVFGVPEPDPLHAFHAVTCGVLIQTIADRITRQRRAEGLPTVTFKIGINSGPVLAGNLGGQERMQFTVVGDTVNVASRLCDLSKPGEVLLADATAANTKVIEHFDLIHRSTAKVRGRSSAVSQYSVDISSFSNDRLINELIEQIFPQNQVSQ